MTEEVYQCFKKLINKRRKTKVEPMVDGVGGFLVLDKNGMPYLALHWEKRFEYALGKYNRIFKEELPIITPHICRHTYCYHPLLPIRRQQWLYPPGHTTYD